MSSADIKCERTRREKTGGGGKGKLRRSIASGEKINEEMWKDKEGSRSERAKKKQRNKKKKNKQKKRRDI